MQFPVCVRRGGIRWWLSAIEEVDKPKFLTGERRCDLVLSVPRLVVLKGRGVRLQALFFEDARRIVCLLDALD